MKLKKRKVMITKKEKFIYSVGILSFIAIFVIQIFFGAQISNVKMNIEKINYQIETQEKKNESLTMQVNELTSYENVSGVIKDLGLAYNNENIIVINK
jgi:Protein required for the initiation of cell division